MKCPLLLISAAKQIEVAKEAYTDCLKEGCAWWDKDKSMCSKVSGTMELRFIRSLLTEIEETLDLISLRVGGGR